MTAGNSVATRNLRLAAIKATMAFQATKAPELLDTIARIHTIPVKKHLKPQVTFLTYGETQALLDAITDRHLDQQTRPSHVHPGGPNRVEAQRDHRIVPRQRSSRLCPTRGLHRQGRKNRTTPLTSTTASLLKVYSQERSTRPGQALFPNPHGFALSADAVQRRLSLHLVRPRPSARTSPTSTSPCIPCATPPRCVSSRPASMPPSSPCGSGTNHKRRQALPPCRHRRETQSSRPHPPA